MHVAMFYHSLLSDWNHGNAHFLRGVAAELLRRGHTVSVFEPDDGWSLRNLVEAEGMAAVEGFHLAYPTLASHFYDLETADLDVMLAGVDLVLVHEWNTHELVRRIGGHRARTRSYLLLFHDTHHRAVSDAAAMASYDLRHYDGVLAFGAALSDVYRTRGWAARVWTWHEAADTHLFRPHPEITRRDDLVWIGNWGDDERTAELREFLLTPVHALGLTATAYGVRYPPEAITALETAGVEYRGFLPNYRVPEALAAARTTVHVPRGPYARQLPGIPTIRVFEALACGVPLLCAPWDDAEGLFKPGADYLLAKDGAQMQKHLRLLLSDTEAAAALAEHGRNTILRRHSCAHRVDELLGIVAEIRRDGRREASTAIASPEA